MELGHNHPSNGANSPVDESGWASPSYKLGANYEENDITFAVYSMSATKVLLEIYEESAGQDAKYDYWMQKSSDNIWRAKIASLPQGTFYGFRCWGPNWEYKSSWKRGNCGDGFITDVDGNGNRFNPNKVLFDPYAKELSHDKEGLDENKNSQMQSAGENGGMYGTGDSLYNGKCTGGIGIVRRNVDTGKWVPKGIAVHDNTTFGTKPRIKQKDAIIYEAHVRGLTKHDSASNLKSILKGFAGFEGVENVPENLRGTYAGAAYMANYLKSLGYTAIELLPIQQISNDDNYWGYMTNGFFAPNRRYSHDKSPGGPTREFKNMVKTFHDAGLEVYLDVVYNHTGEGGLWWGDNPTCADVLSFRGFDNASYYALAGGNKFYWESTGCGNNFNTSEDVVGTLIKDSLIYWTEVMGIDGFRFDLATVLGRDQDAGYVFDKRSNLLKEIAEMADKHKIEVIAEAWDTGTYQVGNFPETWAEWNGRYRDSIRDFMRGAGETNKFIKMVNGDYSAFGDQGGPHKAVNFIVAHDGFTLMDLVSYNSKNNETPWPFGQEGGNGSGSDDNSSWDSGGDHKLRRQRLRNFWTIQFFSRGVPMSVWGDEMGRTQNGNNNPYNVDTIATWNNYNMINTDAPTSVPIEGGAYHNNFGNDINNNNKNALFSFVNKLISIRKSHEALRQDKYADFLHNNEDVSYFFNKEDCRTSPEGYEKSISLRIDGSGIGDNDFLLCINMHSDEMHFQLPTPGDNKKWVRIIDTASWAEDNNNCWDLSGATEINNDYGVKPYAITVLEAV